jgi:hypothetical protein
LFANGYTSSEMIDLFEKYPCDYCHLNRNKNPIGTTDSHVAVHFIHSKWKDYEEVCKYLAKSNKICVVEMTKKELDWKDWEDFAKYFKSDNKLTRYKTNGEAIMPPTAADKNK